MPGVASFQRELSGSVRNKGLRIIEAILDDKIDYGIDFKKQLLLRLAGSILPRLQELSGEGGEPLQVKVIYPNADKRDLFTPMASQGNPIPPEV